MRYEQLWRHVSMTCYHLTSFALMKTPTSQCFLIFGAALDVSTVVVEGHHHTATRLCLCVCRHVYPLYFELNNMNLYIWLFFFFLLTI